MRGFFAGLSIGILAVIVIVQGLAHHGRGHAADHSRHAGHGDVHRGHGGVHQKRHAGGYRRVGHCARGEKVRAAIDIGSSGPSVRVACVRTAEADKFNKFQIVGSPLYEDKRKVPYAAVLKEFQADIAKRIAKGQEPCAHPEFDRFRGLLAFAKRYRPREYRAAATAVFRSPQGAYFIDRLNICFPHLNAKVVDQPMEGQLEYRAVADELMIKEADAAKDFPLVWGIGSTSVQLTFLNKEPLTSELRFAVVDGGSGATKFQMGIVTDRKTKCANDPGTDEVKRKCVKEAGEAHPLSKVEWGHYATAREVYVSGRPGMTALKAALGGHQAVGIGGGHAYLAVTKDNDTKVYEAGAVDASLNNLVGLNDKDILVKLKAWKLAEEDETKVHSSVVSSLVMVDGTMKALSINEVKVVDTDLADGLLVMEKW